MEGVGYLIDYPYGCVEQTMSRFLPAVMVKRAAGQSPIALPPEAAAKLPDVLKKGLERLYNFQHPDGGWGWFEKDARNDPMTVYVLYGLARCRNAGTEVDAEVFARGCAYLQERLASGKMAAADRPAAWLTLALAGRADAAALRADVAGTLRVPSAQPQSLGLLGTGLPRGRTERTGRAALRPAPRLGRRGDRRTVDEAHAADRVRRPVGSMPADRGQAARPTQRPVLGEHARDLLGHRGPLADAPLRSGPAQGPADRRHRGRQDGARPVAARATRIARLPRASEARRYARRRRTAHRDGCRKRPGGQLRAECLRHPAARQARTGRHAGQADADLDPLERGQSRLAGRSPTASAPARSETPSYGREMPAQVKATLSPSA